MGLSRGKKGVEFEVGRCAGCLAFEEGAPLELLKVAPLPLFSLLFEKYITREQSRLSYNIPQDGVDIPTWGGYDGFVEKGVKGCVYWEELCVCLDSPPSSAFE